MNNYASARLEAWARRFGTNLEQARALTQNFVVQQYEGFYPDIEKPFYLFTAQPVGRYRVYVSPISGDFSTDKFTFNVVVTREGPYGVVVLLGLVVLAIGIISVVYSFAPIGKKSLTRALTCLQ